MVPPPTAPAEPTRFIFGHCELRIDTRELWVKGTRQPIRRRVFDLMVHLIRQRPGVVRHDELKQAVWRREDCSQTVLARAVMEARQACGDADGDTRFFLSVHGVGYRFAGEVRSDRAPGGVEGSGASPADRAVEALRDQVREARRASADLRVDEAVVIAEEALARSEALGAQPERVRALLVCASIAVSRRQMPEAARLASHAMQIATAEGDPTLVAESRVAIGQVHVLAGDHATGIRHLREAMDIFREHGRLPDLSRCMDALSRALREQGEFEAALEVCRQRLATMTAPGREELRPGAPDRLQEVELLTDLGDHLEASGDPRGARPHFEAGLERCRSLLGELDRHGQPIDRLDCLDRLSMLLERLGRLDEARALAEDCDALRLRLPPGMSWPDPGQRHRFRLQRARLASHQGDVQALRVVLNEVLSAASTEAPSLAQAELYRLGADMASQHGIHELASEWLKKRCEVLVRIQIDRGAALAAVFAAELNAEALQQELDRARKEAQDVLVENTALRRRVQQLEGSLALSPQTRLAAADQILPRLASAHERACTRGLPLCIGLLKWVGPDAVQAPRLRQAAEALAAHPDVAAPACDLGGGRIVFHVPDAGLARGRAVCTEIAEALRVPNRRLQRAAAGQWHCSAADAAQFPSLRDCLDSLCRPPMDGAPARLLGGSAS